MNAASPVFKIGLWATVTVALSMPPASGDGPRYDGSYRRYDIETPDLGQPIEAGALLCDNRFVPGPYRLTVDAGTVTINDRPVRAFSREQDTFGYRRRRWRPNPYRMAARLSDCLADDGLVVLMDGGIALTVPFPDSVEILGQLIDTALPPDRKVDALYDALPPFVDIQADRFEGFVASFVPDDPALRDRYTAMRRRMDNWIAERQRKNQQAQRKRRRAELLDRVMLPAGLLLAAMALTLLAANHAALTGNRDNPAGWRHVDDSGTRGRRVMRLLWLLLVLNALDLVYTLVAMDGAHFSELNPLADMLTHSSAAVAGYKIGAVALGVGLLVRLRRYRGAEVAVWWLCLVYTLLTIRWASQSTLLQI